jgi:hypothetical protein
VSFQSGSSAYFGQLLAQRLARRDFMRGALAGAALPFASWAAEQGGAIGFAGIANSREDRVLLPPGYTHDVVIRWGESLRTDVPDLDAARLPAGALYEPDAASRQALQFGSNCDAIQFFQLNSGARSEQGLLCVNNEYTDDWLLFPGRRQVFGTDPEHVRAHVREHPAIVPVAQAAHGISIVEARRERGRWGYRRDSRYNRRLTANSPFEIRGPARGAEWMRTAADPTGVRALGTFGNCAGGRTPWGTYLSAEENIQDYFGNFGALYRDLKADETVLRAHLRWRMWNSVSPYGWDVTDGRFDAAREPNEAFRFGWIVEVNPRDPARTPVKRTALGRFAHEAATCVVAASGQLAVYMGDDDRFEYVYKYVSRGRVDTAPAAANDTLLDDGTLYVARFDAAGRGEWLPLVYREDGPLHARAGFRNQAEVLINARGAADLLGATMMDRPEDIEVHPRSGRIYVVCTRNELRRNTNATGQYGNRRIDLGPNAANPRGNNLYGQIIEITEDGDDHTARRFRWDVLLTGGKAVRGASLGSPDNIGFDAAGNLWIVTDGQQPEGGNDGCYVCAVAGPERGVLRQFMSGPVGAEIAGCVFTPDQSTLFLSVQHPGEAGTLERPSSDWPDGRGLPPRSAVIAIRREDGGIVGS